MAELTISADEIRSAIQSYVTEYSPDVSREEVGTVTEQLLRNTLTGPHVGHAENAIERLSEVASRRRGQSVARVTTAAPLAPAQEQRLTEVLGRLYGRAIGLQVTVDPSVLGGLVVQVGDEVIDGSIAHRLEVAGRRLVG